MDAETIVFGEKLRDARWLTFADTVIARDEHFCQCCGGNEQLEVHFLRYTAADPWSEPRHNLTTLCKRCHTIEHVTRSAMEKLLLDSLESMQFLSIDLVELLPHIVRTFAPRAGRLSDDRLRRIQIQSDEISRDPDIAEFTAEVPKIFDRIFRQIDDKDFQVSEEFFDMHAQVLGMLQDRGKRAAELIAEKGALAAPDSTTFSSLQPTTHAITGIESGS